MKLNQPPTQNESLQASTASVMGERTAEYQRIRTRHLTQLELARRWAVSPRTLERWRWLKQGPCYLKLMGRIVYRLEDIEAFESNNRQEIFAGSGPIGSKI